jgi:hypothetical protein
VLFKIIGSILISGALMVLVSNPLIPFLGWIATIPVAAFIYVAFLFVLRALSVDDVRMLVHQFRPPSV